MSLKNNKRTAYIQPTNFPLINFQNKTDVLCLVLIIITLRRAIIRKTKQFYDVFNSRVYLANKKNSCGSKTVSCMVPNHIITKEVVKKLVSVSILSVFKVHEHKNWLRYYRFFMGYLLLP